jgi:hypothetical protein
VRWFGESWGAPVNETTEHVETPVGQPCEECRVQIKADDSGFLIPDAVPLLGEAHESPWHFDCLMRHVLGPYWETRL